MGKVSSLGPVLNLIENVNGHVAVALLNNDPTCKRLCIRAKAIILQSAPRDPDRYVMEGDDFSIYR